MDKISIVICSQKTHLEDSFLKNIKETVIGDYELVVINNSKNTYSIFEAYNNGISKSTTPYLVFIHEDILFKTKGWDLEVIRLFKENSNFGLIGVAGSKIKTKTPSGWWDCETKYKLVNIIQHLEDQKVEFQQIGFKTQFLEEVAIIDGVFMACRKLSGIKFNESLEGFHGYDLNLCFEVLHSGYKIGVTNLILIEHYSIGTLNLEWLKSNINIHNIYKAILPISMDNLDMKGAEVFSLKRLLNKLLFFKEKKLFIQYWTKLFLLKPFSKKHLKLIRTLTKKIIRK